MQQQLTLQAKFTELPRYTTKPTPTSLLHDSLRKSISQGKHYDRTDRFNKIDFCQYMIVYC